jgi:hypothetical protein
MVVLGSQFQVDASLLAVGGLVFDTEVRQGYFAIDYREAVCRRDFGLAIGVLAGPETVGFGEFTVDLFLELEVEHYSIDAATLSFNPRRLGLEHAVDCGIMGSFSGLHESGVKGLIGTVEAGVFKHLFPFTSEGIDWQWLASLSHRDGPALDKALSFQVEVIAMEFTCVPLVTESEEIVFTDGAEPADIAHGVKLGFAEIQDAIAEGNFPVPA